MTPPPQRPPLPAGRNCRVPARHTSLVRLLISLVCFAAAFGYLEAAVVVYLRAHYEPLRSQVYGELPQGELFPLLSMEQLESAGPPYRQMLLVELGREFATLVMLAAVPLAFACDVRQWLAATMIAFGVWDISYYVFLKLLIGWPASLLTWDLLFLLPVPWVGPVWSPVLVAVSMIVAGVIILWRDARGRPVCFRPLHWVAICGGGLTVVLAFCWGFPAAARGEVPTWFNWPLFALGELVGLAGFTSAYFNTTAETADLEVAEIA